MATISERLAYVLTFDVSSGVKSVQKFGATADKELSKADQKLDKLAGSMTKFGAGAMAFAGVAGVGLFKLASGAADASANMSALEQVVGEAVANDIGAWAEGSAQAVGLASKEAVAASTQFAGLGKIIGLAGEPLAAFAQSHVELAADMAAFKNVSPQQAIEDLSSAYAGSTEVLRKYNIFLDDRTLKEAYARETGEAVTGTLTTQQKIIAVNSELYRQGADMIGQFGRESGELAGQQAILKAEMTNLGDEIGAGVLPHLVKLMGVAGQVVGVFGSLDKATNGAVGSFAAYGTAALAVGGAMSFVVGQLIKMRDAFAAVRASQTLTALSANAGPLAALAVTIGAVAWNVSQWGRNQKEAIAGLRAITDMNLAKAAADMESLAAAAQSLESPTAAVAARLRELALEAPDLSAAIADAGLTLEDLAQLMVDGRWSNTVGFNKFTDAAGNTRVISQELVDELIQLDHQATTVGRNFEDMAAVSDDVTGATEDVTAATGDARDVLLEYAEAQREARDAASEAAAGAFDLETAALAVDEAVAGLTEATRENALIQLDGTRSDEEKAAAQRALRGEQIDTAETVWALSEAIVAETGATEGSLEATQQQIDTLSVLKGKYPEIADDIQTMIDELLKVPGTVAGSTFDIGTALAQGIRDGVNGSAWEIAAALKQAVEEGKISAKLAAKVRSPSAVFRDEVGKPLSQGIAEGVEEDAHKIAEALTDAIEDATDDAVEAAEKLVEEAQAAFDGLWDGIGDRFADRDLGESVADADAKVAESLGEVEAAQAELDRLIAQGSTPDYERIQEATEGLAEAKDAHADAIERESDAARAAKRAQEDLAEVQADGEATARELEDAVERVSDSQTALADATKGVTDAEREQMEALGELNEALNSPAVTAEELREAEEDLQKAKEDHEAAIRKQEDAYRKLAEAKVDMLGGTPDEIAAFEDIARKAGLTEVEIRDLAAAYRELAAARGAAVSTADGDRARRVIDDFAEAAAGGLIDQDFIDSLEGKSNADQIDMMAGKLNDVSRYFGWDPVQYHAGGVVRGAAGANVPIMAQAGERVMSRAEVAESMSPAEMSRAVSDGMVAGWRRVQQLERAR